MLLDFRNVSARAPLSQAGRADNGIITMIINFIWMLVEFKIYTRYCRRVNHASIGQFTFAQEAIS